MQFKALQKTKNTQAHLGLLRNCLACHQHSDQIPPSIPVEESISYCARCHNLRNSDKLVIT